MIEQSSTPLNTAIQSASGESGAIAPKITYHIGKVIGRYWLKALQGKGKQLVKTKRKDVETSIEHTYAPFTFAKATSAHQTHPERNEDYLLIDQKRGLAVICDGVGGLSDADQAARVAARTVREHWQDRFKQFTERSSPITLFDLKLAARYLLEEANRSVLELCKHLAEGKEQSSERKDFAGTTIALALFTPYLDSYLMTYAHIGDSRIYLLRNDAALQRLTVDDGYFLWLMCRGEMNERDAMRIDQASSMDQLSEKERDHFRKRNRITQSLGQEHITIHVDQIALFPHDRILLCTDGVHDNLTDAEIEEILRKGARTTVAKTLLQQTVARSQQEKTVCFRAKKDDMSAIIVTCHFSPGDNGKNGTEP